MTFAILTFLFSLDGARAITHSIAIGDEPRDCVEAQIQQRTLRISTSRMKCSAVAVNVTTIRFAGHCFPSKAGIGGIYDAKGKYLGEDGTIRREGGYQASVTYDLPDQAEASYDRPLVNVGPIEFADVENLPADNRVVIAGYGFARFNGPVWKHPFPVKGLRYSWGHVDRLPSRVPFHRGQFAFRFTPDHPRSSAASGDDGAPAFLVEGCTLKFIGVVVGRKIPLFEGKRTTWIRPHTDLPTR